MSYFSYDDDDEFVNKIVLDDSDNFFWLKSADYTGVVKPKMLTAPILETGSGLVHPEAGTWPADKLLEPATLLRWGFLVLEPSGHGQVDYAGIISSIQKYGCDMGMEMAPPVVQKFNLHLQELQKEMMQSRMERVHLLFIVLPEGKREYYNLVKRAAELLVGITTQCIREKTVWKGMRPQIMRNILLKSSRYHSGVPCSIAALTASIDAKFARYNVQMRIQAAKKEEIVDLEDMMLNHLLVYFKYHRTLPTTIIYYRTAMPTTLYDELESYEKDKLIKACRQFVETLRSKGYPVFGIKLIVITVETPRNERLAFTNFGNPTNTRPGLVVKAHNIPIDSFKQTRFSMVSYQAKREARLTSYFIFYNGGIQHTELEQLSYYLCYLSGLSTRSLKLPAPLYYARLACRHTLALSYGMRLHSEDLEEEPRIVEVCSSLTDWGRLFFV